MLKTAVGSNLKTNACVLTSVGVEICAVCACRARTAIIRASGCSGSVVLQAEKPWLSVILRRQGRIWLLSHCSFCLITDLL